MDDHYFFGSDFSSNSNLLNVHSIDSENFFSRAAIFMGVLIPNHNDPINPLMPGGNKKVTHT